MRPALPAIATFNFGIRYNPILSSILPKKSRYFGFGSSPLFAASAAVAG
jgi:hypothetical protein